MADKTKTPRNGSSPLAWGIPEDVVAYGLDYRFIPTRVGYTHKPDGVKTSLSGSSPLAWGIRMDEITGIGYRAVHPHSRGVYGYR